MRKQAPPAASGTPPHSGWPAAGFAAGCIAALLVFAPARWLAAAADRASAGRVLLSDARGSVWNGSARLVLTGGPGASDSAALPGRVAWRLRPGIGGLSATFEAACCTDAPLHMMLAPRIGGGRLAIADGGGHLPAAALSGLGTPWNTVQPRGELRLSTQGLSIEWSEGRIAIGGRAQIDAVRIASRLSTLAPLGTYRITVNGGSTAMLQLQTLEGSLRLDGSGELAAGRRLRFDGTASAAPQHEAALSNLLTIIGRRDGARARIRIG